jgi:transcriptional/translational regulatory protein YebC/TACO1
VFERKGIFNIPAANISNMEDFEMEVIDAGAEDIEVDTENEMVNVTTAMEDFGAMVKKLEALKIEVEKAQLERLPITTLAVDVDTAKKVLRAIEIFEEDDDVQNLYHNMEMTDEIMEAME